MSYKFKLRDMKPEESTFELVNFPGRKFTLKKFSIATRIWCDEQFGEGKLEDIIAKSNLVHISKIVHHMLKLPNEISLEELQENICGYADQNSVFDAFMKSVAGATVLQDIRKNDPEEAEVEGNVPAQTGPTSTTSSPASTDTASNNSST